MKKLITTVNVEGSPRKYDIMTEFRFCGFLESHVGGYRLEILECPDEPAHAVVVKVPYPADPSKPEPDVSKATLAYENVSSSSIRPAVLWALNRVEQDIHDAYLAAREEERAEKAKAKAEAEAAKEAKRKQREKEQAERAKQNGKPAKGKSGHTPNGNGKPATAKAPATSPTVTAKRKPASEEEIRRKTRG
jgi:hypothetical protein